MPCGWAIAQLTLAGRPCSAFGTVGLVTDGRKLGLLCSSKCPADVIVKAYDFARLVRGSGVTLVSGFHSPIEKDCLPVLLRGPDPIIICQGRRLSTARLPDEWKQAIVDSRLLLISPFTTNQKRVTSALAEERNRFVAAISDEVLIAYAHHGGKTEFLTRELLEFGKRVYTFECRANAFLVRMGAIAIEPDHFAPKRQTTSA